MCKCFGCGMNLFPIMEKAKKIRGVKLNEKFFKKQTSEEFSKLLDLEKLDDCCRLIIITHIENHLLHYL